MSKRFARAGDPTGSEAITSADLVAHATPHTVGSWVEIDAAAAQDCSGLWVASSTVIGATNTATAMLVELGFGGAAAEVSQVQWYVGGHNTYIYTFLPLHIPAGTRLSGRIQALITVDIFTPQVILEYANRGFAWGGYTGATPIGLNLAASTPTTADLADNAWDEAVASTAEPYRALSLHCGVNVNAASAVAIVVDVGVGGAGAEVPLGSWLVQTTTSELVTTHAGPTFIEVNVPAGSRLAIRKNTTGDLTGHLIGWR